MQATLVGSTRDDGVLAEIDSSCGARAARGVSQYGRLFYNVTCCESPAGRTPDALEHLRRAVDLSERCRSLAQDDPDFDPIRDEPAFNELIGR